MSRKHSIKNRITFMALASTALALLLAFASSSLYTILDSRDQSVHALQTLAEITAINSQASVMFMDPAAAMETLNALAVRKDMVSAEILLANGTVLARKIFKNNIPASANWVNKIMVDTTLTIVHPINMASTPLGTVKMISDLSPLWTSIIYSLAINLGALLFAFSASLLLVRKMRGSIISPIKNLGMTAERIAKTAQYSLRVSKQTDDELGQLTDQFNFMLNEIEQRDRDLTRNSDDLKSELSLRKKAEKHLAHLAHYDHVTQLPNRHYFNDHLAKVLDNAIRTNSKICLLFIDLDNFKGVNDTLGHHVGDLLLQEVGLRLNHFLTEEMTICRIGGDEFSLIIEHIANSDQAGVLAEKIINELAQSFVMEDKEIFIGASIGISSYPGDADDLSGLLRCADIAMYHAKESGKNNVKFFDPFMEDRSSKRFTLGNNLRKAYDQNEFQLYYQPQVNLENGEIFGFEALIRWLHPEDGLINPVDFIPLAEANGLIMPIGEWVIRTACQQAKIWQDSYGANLIMSINISGRQLKEINCVETILNILEETGVPPELIKLELTESILMENADLYVNMLDELHFAGIDIAIDDFGTGYSSLAYLKRYTIKYLKIDSSFVQDVPYNTDDNAICQAIIAMAHSLNLTTIAEGIESEEQLEFLRENGCHFAQGYLISRPLPADEIETRFIQPTFKRQ